MYRKSRAECGQQNFTNDILFFTLETTKGESKNACKN